MLYNNLSYTQVTYAFVPQKDLDIFLGSFFAFFFFFRNLFRVFLSDFDIFHVRLFFIFLMFICHFYIEKKIIKNILYALKIM